MRSPALVATAAAGTVVYVAGVLALGVPPGAGESGEQVVAWLRENRDGVCWRAESLSAVGRLKMDKGAVQEMIFGRWRSQILYAGVKLGVFEVLGQKAKDAAAIAKDLTLDPALSYRLLRALASLGLLSEH